MYSKLLKKYINAKSISLLLGLYFIFLLCLQIYLHSKDYLRPFRKDFLFTLYQNSQWVNPQSKYGIGDDGLYQVAGYTLATKHEFFTINPEMPPLAKYIYGYSILLFGNAEIASLLMFIISIIVFWFLIRKYIKNLSLQICATIFFITDPLLFEQSYMTMFDLPQLIFLLLHFLIMINLFKNDYSFKKYLTLILLAGVTLGLFMSVKIAFLAVIIGVLDVFILYSRKKIVYFGLICCIALVIYIGAYLPYLLQGHTLFELLKAQKWMLNFYLSSGIRPVYGTVLTTLSMGKIIGWGEFSKWENVSHWTIVWTLYLFTFLVFGFQTLSKFSKKNNTVLFPIFLLISGLLLSFIFLPFFTRYLVLILPFFILLFFIFFESLSALPKGRYIILGVVFCIHYYIRYAFLI